MEIPYSEELKNELISLVQKFVKEKEIILFALAELIINNESSPWYPQIIKELVSIEFSLQEAKDKFSRILSHRNKLCLELKRPVGLSLAALDYFTYIEHRLINPVVVETNKINELLGLSRHDGLTGLLNNRAYVEIVQNEVAMASRYNMSFCLVIMDIDHFKEYNDTYGHIEGDLVLKNIAEALSKNIRNCDYVFRYGGEEFVLILINTSKKKAVLTVERLRRVIKFLTFKRQVTISAGIASFPDDGPVISECFIKSDQALYQAKEEGRDRAKVYYLETRKWVILYKNYFLPVLFFLKKNRVTAFFVLLSFLSIFSFYFYFNLDQLMQQGRWGMVFKDDFKRTKIGDEWKAYLVKPVIGIEKAVKDEKRSLWKIVNNELCAKSLDINSFLVYSKKINGNIRLEFDARLVYPGKSDINAFIYGTNKNDGYAFHIGGWGNKVTAITRSGVISALTSKFLINTNTKYHITVERINDQLKLYVNNKMILKYKDYFLLEGDSHNGLGLDVENTHVHFDNVKIFRLSVPLKISPLIAANSFFEKGFYEVAIEQYREILKVYPQQNIAAQSRFQIATCYMLLNKFSEAKEELIKLIHDYPKNPLVAYALLKMAIIFDKEGRIDVTEKIILEATKKYNSEAFINTAVMTYSQLLNEVNRNIKTDSLQSIKILERKASFLLDNFPEQFFIYNDAVTFAMANYLSKGYYDDSLRIFNKLLKVSLKNKQYSYEETPKIIIGETFAAKGDYAKAIEVWNKVNKNTAGAFKSLYLSAIALRESGRPEEAIANLKELRSLLKKNQDINCNFITILLALMQQEKADMREATRELQSIYFYPENSELSELNDTITALADFLKGEKTAKELGLIPDLYNFKFDLWFFIGEKCFHDLKFDDAKAAYRKFIDNPYTRIGITYYIAKERLEKIESLIIK